MLKCPSCGSVELRRSSTTAMERFRRQMFGGDPYRCKSCGWRGWRTIDEGPAYVEKKKSKAPTFDPTAALGAVVLIVLTVAVVGLILLFNSSMFASAPA